MSPKKVKVHVPHFYLALGVTWCHFYHTQIVFEAVKRSIPVQGERTQASPLNGRSIKVNLRRTCAMGDSVVAICHNVLQWKVWMLFQSWLWKMRWKGHEEYSMSQRRKGRVRAQSTEENLCCHLLSGLISSFTCKATAMIALWFFFALFPALTRAHLDGNSSCFT